MNGLIRKQLGYKRRGKRRMGRRKAMKLYRQPKFYGGKKQNYQLEISIPVFLYSGTGPSYAYSFSTTQISRITQCFNSAAPGYSADSANMFNSYLFYRINGIKLSFTRSINAALTTVYQLPALYMDIVQDLNQTQAGNIDARTICESDTALEIQVLNTHAIPPSKYYAYGSDLFSNLDGEVTSGKGVWMNTARTPVHNLIIGSLDAPSLSSPTEQPKVGTILITYYLQFCKRLKMNSYSYP